VALGGGLEVAMACNARVANKGAQLGLPELTLGARTQARSCVPRTSHDARPVTPPLPLPLPHAAPSLPAARRAGIIPGFGGTARLPRLVGLEKGLTMMLRSKNIKADEGAKSGLIDLLVPAPDAVLPAAKALALDIAAGKKPKVQALKKADKLPNMMARFAWALRACVCGAGADVARVHACVFAPGD
jgi:enoyl-CoA hydratase/3-hydroxyacyl-CoA dehydrogenase